MNFIRFCWHFSSVSLLRQQQAIANGERRNDWILIRLRWEVDGNKSNRCYSKPQTNKLKGEVKSKEHNFIVSINWNNCIAASISHCSFWCLRLDSTIVLQLMLSHSWTPQLENRMILWRWKEILPSAEEMIFIEELLSLEE